MTVQTFKRVLGRRYYSLTFCKWKPKVGPQESSWKYTLVELEYPQLPKESVTLGPVAKVSKALPK